MSEAAALAIVIRTFPGLRVIPQLHASTDGLEPCIACGHSTVLRDTSGLPFHRPCLDAHS